MHRPTQGKVKNVMLWTVAGEWFASVQTEHEAQIPLNRGPAVGLDLGRAQAFIFSDRTIIDRPRTTRADRKRVANGRSRRLRQSSASRAILRSTKADLAESHSSEPAHIADRFVGIDSRRLPRPLTA